VRQAPSRWLSAARTLLDKPVCLDYILVRSLKSPLTLRRSRRSYEPDSLDSPDRFFSVSSTVAGLNPDSSVTESGEKPLNLLAKSRSPDSLDSLF
jgi:hypothetical protein